VKKILSLAVALIALTGCDIEGQLNVSQPLTMIAKDNQQLTLQPGIYKADVEAGDNKIKLEVRVNGKDRKVNIRTRQQLPRQNGDIFVSAAQSGQPFDADGSVRTVQDSSGRQHGWEACTTYQRRWVCRDVLVGRDRWGNPIYRRQCADELIAVPGQQEVEFHVVTTTTQVDIALLAPGSNNQLAVFTGDRSTAQRVIDYRGYCR
jgi:hypothetical protein